MAGALVRVDRVDLHIGQRIRLARTQKGVRMTQLARDVGLSVGQVQKYERAENAVRGSILHRIARALKVRPQFFFDGLDDSSQKLDPDMLKDLHFNDWDFIHAYTGLTGPTKRGIRLMVFELAKEGRKK